MDPERRTLWRRLYHGETSIDFVGRWRRWFLISALVILAGVASLVTRGFNLGLEFTGGTSWEVKAPDVSVSEARRALRSLGLASAKIQVVGDDTLRVTADVTDESRRSESNRGQVSTALAKLAGVPAADVNVNDVGPSWGEEVTNKARRALIFFLLAITAYITLRFEWRMALATLVALFHDVLVTAGVYSLGQFEVTPATVIAILTVLGYSIYDGVVVFDRVEENAKGLSSAGRVTYGEMVNLSLNQVLMRTLNTSITALLPISSLLVIGSLMLGATTLQEFALALLVGLGASAYSSIFIASPLLALLKEREPRYAALRKGGHRAASGPVDPRSDRADPSGARGGRRRPEVACPPRAGGQARPQRHATTAQAPQAS